MDYQTRLKLKEYLRGFITAERRAKMDAVLKQRTRHVTFALENIYQPHNASAVLRSSEINGIQDLHIIENENRFSPSKEVAMGSAKWLTLTHYRDSDNNTLHCMDQLKAKGYQLVATTPHRNDCCIEDLPVDKPLALLFGTELEGLSQEAIDHAHQHVRIPMYGFTESYNISVSAALCAYEIMRRLRQSKIPWTLSSEEKTDLQIEWCRKSIKHAHLLEKQFLKTLK